MSVTPEVCQLEIRVEILQVIEEPAHVGDARDFPVGGGRVSVERLDRRHGEALSPDPSSSHTQHSRGEGRGARPRATDEQLVGVGQGGCVLPSRKEGIRCGVRCEPGGGSRQLFTMPKRCARRRHNTSRAARARASEAGGGGRLRRMQHTGRARVQTGSRARGGAHPEHVAHVRDAGGVEAQRLVEGRRALPRANEGHTVWCEVQSTGRREVAGDRGAPSVQGRARI
eukprot:scaffold3067_cov67-Phaeocystis_antarctica.AAC.3